MLQLLQSGSEYTVLAVSLALPLTSMRAPASSGAFLLGDLLSGVADQRRRFFVLENSVKNETPC